MILALLASLLLSAVDAPARIDAALYVSAVVWGHDPAEFEALAWCESKLETNPRRYGTGKRWGYPPLGKRWKICGLLQLHGGKAGKGTGVLPRCELQILLPELAAWYGAAHLAGWRRACGKARQWDCFNRGWPRNDCGHLGEVRAETSRAGAAAGKEGQVKRTCSGCRALGRTVSVYLPGSLRCELGFKVRHVSQIEIVPVVECPKPRTWAEYAEASQEAFEKLTRQVQKVCQ